MSELSSLHFRDATEEEMKRATRDKDAIVVEWDTGVTFLASYKELVLIRMGSMGADVKDIHWGRKYLSPLHLGKEVGEVQIVARGMRRIALN